MLKTWPTRTCLALVLVAVLVGVPLLIIHRWGHTDAPAAAGAHVAVPKVGVHENYQGPDATTLAQTAARFPLAAVTREFTSSPIGPQDLVRPMTAVAQPAWDAGETVAWSFKPQPAAVTSGAWKPYVIKLGRYIKTHALQDKVIVIIWHEPENNVPHYFKNAAAFVTMFNTVAGWLTSVDATIVTSHAALGYYYHNLTAAQARQWVTDATIQSIDMYSGKSFPLAMTLGTSKAFQVWKASRPAGSRWGVSERGWLATPALSAARVRAIDAETAWLTALPAADWPSFYIVWNTSGSEHEKRIVLDPAGRAAVNTMFVRLAALATKD